MFLLQIRNTLAVATASLAALLLITSAAPAQTDVPDGPLAFWNATDMEITVEVRSVFRRNGTETPVNLSWDFKPGECSWVSLNNQKIPGVSVSYVVRTPGGQASGWTARSNGLSQEGYFTVSFTEEDLRTHQKSPLQPGRADFTFPSAAEMHRQFLEQQIARVQTAIQEDEELILKNMFASGGLRVAGEGIESYGNQSDKPGDAVAGAILKALADEVASTADRTRARVQARVRANRQLLQKYTAELNAASGVTFR